MNFNLVYVGREELHISKGIVRDSRSYGYHISQKKKKKMEVICHICDELVHVKKIIPFLSHVYFLLELFGRCFTGNQNNVKLIEQKVLRS